MNSSIAAARAALYRRLVDGLADVQVTFGPPGEYEANVVVALTGVVEPSEEWAALGAGRSEESYGIAVAVKVHDPAATANRAGDVDARGFELADVVRGICAAHRTLDDTVRTSRVSSQRTDGVRPVADADGGGWVIFVELTVECRQRVTGG